MANGTCVSFCNQPKAKFGYLTRVTPVCRCLHPFCGWRHLATSRESKAHFGLPRYAPVTIAVNVTWMKKGFTACKTPRCMYPSIFNRFWDIASHWSKIATFSYPTYVYRPRRGFTPSEFRDDLDTHKTRMNGLSCGEESMTIAYVQPFWCNTSVWQTNRRTDRIGMTCISISADARKNCVTISVLLGYRNTFFQCY